MCAVIYLLVVNIIAINKKRPVSIFGYSYSYVPTGSMEPTINVNDTIIFKKTDFNKLNVGDIIVYYSNKNNIYIVHRIVDIEYDDTSGMIDYVKTQGDNKNTNPDPDDEDIHSDMFIGIYVRKFNFLNIAKITQNKNVIYVVLVIIFLSLIVFEGINMYLTASKNKIKEKSKEEIKQDMLDKMRAEILEEIKKENKDGK